MARFKIEGLKFKKTASADGLAMTNPPPTGGGANPAAFVVAASNSIGAFLISRFQF